jgi:diguanylate cyclase (GGDEF)-like protein
MNVNCTPEVAHTDCTWEVMQSVLDSLCPMHLRLNKSGHIVHVGPTLAKLRPSDTLLGKRFLEVFKLDRPRAITTMSDLMSRARSKLHLELRGTPKTALKGVLVHLPPGQGAVVDLSFGISVAEGVQDYNLTSGDFAATDLAIEMLYLVEAKSAAMEASHCLTQRLQSAKVAAEEQAFTDPLTGLKNRRAADHMLAELIEDKNKFSLMHVDLDFFKTINDTKGHAAGDYVLQVAADVMRNVTRKGDAIARVGGDEFMILFEGLVAKPRLESIAGQLIKSIEEPIDYQGEPCKISASIGVSIFTGDDEDVDLDILVQRSDLALYASKRAGRGRYTFFDNLHDTDSDLSSLI